MLSVGLRVRILVPVFGTKKNGTIYDVVPSRPYPYHVRPDDWPDGMPGIAYTETELEPVGMEKRPGHNLDLMRCQLWACSVPTQDKCASCGRFVCFDHCSIELVDMTLQIEAPFCNACWMELSQASVQVNPSADGEIAWSDPSRYERLLASDETRSKAIRATQEQLEVLFDRPLLDAFVEWLVEAIEMYPLREEARIACDILFPLNPGVRSKRGKQTKEEQLEDMVLASATIDGFVQWMFQVLDDVPLTQEAKQAVDAVFSLRSRLLEEIRQTKERIKEYWLPNKRGWNESL